MINIIKKLFHKHNWKIKERSNIIQYDDMGYVLRLFIVKCSCGKSKQMWIDSAECKSDCVCKWSKEEAGLPISPKGEEKMTDSNKYLIAVNDIENNERFLMYESTISPQLNTQLYFPHLGLYNVEKIVYHISDDHSKSEYEELMFIDVMVSKVN